MAEGFGRYLVLIGANTKDSTFPRKMERIKAGLGSLVAPVMGGDAYVAFGVVTDFDAGEIAEMIWKTDKTFKVSAFQIGKDFSLGSAPMGQNFYEIMSQHPTWKSRRDEDWD
jgi:hypothetical protein